jgi:calcineurin-like phosphoesterase family protein
MTTWFTSDTHFGHANILRYCGRPFPHADAMDEALITRWNDAVGGDDVIYHLGDFILKSRGFARRTFARLRGRIHVLGLPWHHDKGWVPKTTGPCADLFSASGHPVEILPPLLALKLTDGAGRQRLITLSHYPLAAWEAGHHGAWHLHGHSHGEHRGEGAILDVGVDCHGYAPVSLEALDALMPATVSRRDHG